MKHNVGVSIQTQTRHVYYFRDGSEGRAFLEMLEPKRWPVKLVFHYDNGEQKHAFYRSVDHNGMIECTFQEYSELIAKIDFNDDLNKIL